jgi:hypothetical protein
MGDSNINSETAHLFEPLECSDKLGCASPEWTIPQTVKQRMVAAMRDSKKCIQFLLRRRRSISDQGRPQPLLHSRPDS